ncbi:hypothetical protein ACKLNO_11930 [Neisseriaceae bacterium B1]
MYKKWGFCREKQGFRLPEKSKAIIKSHYIESFPIKTVPRCYFSGCLKSIAACFLC